MLDFFKKGQLLGTEGLGKKKNIGTKGVLIKFACISSGWDLPAI